MKGHLARFVALLLAVSGGATAQEKGSGFVRSSSGDSILINSREASVTVVTIPRRAVLLQTVHGGYERHKQVFEEFMRYAEATYTTVGACFGIYPMDPDAVKKSDLTWQVGVEVGVGAPGHVASLSRAQSPDRVLRNLRAPKSGYRLAILPATSAAILASTVERTSLDGLSITRWMTEHGYVQTAPTRMEYLSHTGPALRIPTRIVVPVVERERGLRLAPKPPRMSP